jgi:aspartyl-tRNA(Asn)/glutamyl-tRNA(Gln) amidotransferase subunit C
MEITKAQVARIADLARLEIKEEVAEKFAFQFSEIIGYMDKMNSLGAKGVEPLYSPWDNPSLMREDVAQDEHDRQALLSNAPAQDGQYFTVPKIL